MRVRADPLTVAVALGLLGPIATGGEGRLEILDDDVGVLERLGGAASASLEDASPARRGAIPGGGAAQAEMIDGPLADVLRDSSTVEYALLPEDEGGWPP